jgi:uncharacterized protein
VSREAHETPDQKFTRLLTLLQEAGSAVLAFSGGVDSSFLLRAMKTAGMRFVAVTGWSETVPESALRQAVSFAGREGVAHTILPTGEMQNELFLSNPPDRCFFCKQDLFRKLQEIAETGDYLFVFDGSNADDDHDYRPGRKAASLAGVRSPLAECGLTKPDIRSLSRKLGLETWDRPASPCLASRLPYGQRITPELLKKVESAEEFLRTLGMTTVRVRAHGDMARIEMPEEDIPRILERGLRHRVTEAFRSLGFCFVSLDLEGFRSGSMNRSLPREIR